MAEGMKIRATLQGDVADVKSLMNHIMETGLRKDAKTGKLIPAHFINQVVATLNGKTVLEAQWGAAISKNPFLGFKIKGAKAGDKIVINTVDNNGEKISGETTVA
ncbi:MAG: thiosulfate oxidation carrier complex protein SoxZ [Betaproteobacteria bacterium]|nr:thiosulfate oxidation carrier complex protein SoxZ [Betaproteobacteria bacterium]